jgi:U4/U6 small nuclear ribonucleoprotein PRP31
MMFEYSFSLEGGEYGDSSMGLDRGMVGHKDSGRLRVTQQKNSQQLAKRAKGGQQQQKSNISASQGSGLQSSLIFTPVQGIELVNPNVQADKLKAANNKWFSNYSGFMSAAPK